MVTFENRQLLVDGKPIFLLSGETHYFRQPRENWQHLIDEAKALGLNCIASYVPWLLHEEEEGRFDFSGNLDLGAFIDLCARNGLYFFVRPGPFIMAEMKNEGIPYWVAEKYPDAVPAGFAGGQQGGTALDYLHPGYLRACEKWYQAVMPILVPRLHSNGGNIIGVQLDNEVGMLNWITNRPLLTDHALHRFTDWLAEKGQLEGYPFQGDRPSFFAALRAPRAPWDVRFHLDFGDFLRDYYAEYVLTLKRMAQEAGIAGVPFFLNLHGTGEGRIFDYPISLSQLSRAWNAQEGMVSGTDVYLGEPREGTYQDLYVANALTHCMNKKGSPLTSIEFECSDGPYCSLSGLRFHPNATSLNMLMCLSQGARMINFYVFSGGENYLLRHPRPDGNGRMSFTGQLHGYNAPVQPDGTRNFAFGPIARTARAMHALGALTARSSEVTDDVALGFMPDYYLTEMCYEQSPRTREIQENLKKWRCAGAIDSVARGLLGHGVHFSAVDIQNEEIPADKLLVLLSARYMAAAVQQKVLSFLRAGGRALLYGELPQYDLAGEPCALLLAALGLSSPAQRSFTPAHPYYVTPEAVGIFQGAAPAPHISRAQAFPLDSDGILKLWGEDSMCGFYKAVGAGRLLAITCDYPADMGFYARALSLLGVAPKVRAPYWRQGIYSGLTQAADGQRILYLLNLDDVEKQTDVTIEGKIVLPGFVLQPKAAYMLPLGVEAGGMTVLSATAEIVEIGADFVRLRATQPTGERLRVAAPGGLECPGARITPDGDAYQVTTDARPGDEFCLHLRQRKGA